MRRAVERSAFRRNAAGGRGRTSKTDWGKNRLRTTNGRSRHSPAASEENVAEQDSLVELARQYGIEVCYPDMAGKVQKAPRRALKEILKLWGVSARTQREVRDALREKLIRDWREVVPPVTVCWDGKPCEIELRLPDEAQSIHPKCRMIFEDGNCRSIDWAPERLRSRAAAEIDGQRYVCMEFPVPGSPLGYHRLEFELGHRVHQCLIISAPTRSYSPPGEPKSWGLFLPLYAAHSARSWGAGNLSDWSKLAKWTAANGGRVAATLPLLAAFLKEPVLETSPYRPVSRLFWNEFYLDIEQIPDFRKLSAAQKLVKSKAFQARLAAFRADPMIDYGAQMALRREVLELLARRFFDKTNGQRRFRDFLMEKPAVLDYAEFRATCEQQGEPWNRWEERMRYGRLEPGDYAQENKEYHLYVQWQMHQQLSDAARTARESGSAFYLDMPTGVHPEGYDVWRHQDFFALGASVGAPPDPYFPNGQNWGFAPLHPERIRRLEYRYWRDMLRNQMQQGLLRVDHIMSLHRLYWIPPGLPPSMGAYVRYPDEEYYAILSLESHRRQTVIVGENLGTVPPEVNQSMARHHFRETYVLQYERGPDAARALRPPPARSVASLNTHDMPPFAAHWSGADIQKRVELKLFPAKGSEKERRRREQLNQALRTFLRKRGLLERNANANETEAVLRACLEWLARSKAEFVLVNLEDLLGEQEWQNVPGTTQQHPNWRRKARLSLEEIFHSPRIRRGCVGLRRGEAKR